jgi:CubicO group peptidase (beta-lactamase class C family)
MTRPNTQMGRRQFLSAGMTLAVTAALDGSASGEGARQDRHRPWIPSEEFLAKLPDIMEIASLPGLTIATVEEGEVVWTRAFGVTNVDTRTPVRQDSVFEVASLSKPAFAYVVMKLVDEKLIDLDRPLVQYRRPDYLANDPNVDLITARDVLRHSTGFPNWRWDPEGKLTPVFKPGSHWRYSGEGFFWLRLVVEKVTGQGLETVMRSRLFDPAKMTLSTFAWNPEIARLSVYAHEVRQGNPWSDEVKVGFQHKRWWGDRLLAIAAKWGQPISTWTYEDLCRAIPEARVLEGFPPLPEEMAKQPIGYWLLPVRTTINQPASMLSTTAGEYARFMALMMQHPHPASWEIAEESRRAMLSPQFVLRKETSFWGLGWGLEQSPSGLLFYHSGRNDGEFVTFCVGDPVRRRAIVIFTNASRGDRVYERIVRAATGYDMLAFI